MTRVGSEAARAVGAGYQGVAQGGQATAGEYVGRGGGTPNDWAPPPPPAKLGGGCKGVTEKR